MIEQLQETMTRHAERVTPIPDPYIRVVRRRRRRQRRMMTACVLVVLLVMIPATYVVVDRGGSSPYVTTPGPPPAALLPLLNSPTRGSLAADQAFTDRIRQRAADEIDEDRGRPGGGPQMPDDPSMIKVLFAGDLGDLRIAIVAGMDGNPLQATFQGQPGDDADDLYNSASGEMSAVVATGFSSSGADPLHPYLLLGPTGAVYEQAQTRYRSDGVERTWFDVTTTDDYLGLADVNQPMRIRVRIGDQVVYEDQVFVRTTAEASPPTVDPQPVFGRGKPMPTVAVQVAQSITHQTGLRQPEVSFRVLWSDEIPMEGTSNGWAYIATVQAVTSDGGGPYYTLAFDGTGPDAAGRDHPTGSGSAGDPQSALIVMRLPHYVEEVDTILQIIAPPRAVRVEVIRAGQTAGTDLTNGIGQLRMPRDSAAEVRVYDANGALVATKQFVDRNAMPCDVFDPDSCPPQ